MSDKKPNNMKPAIVFITAYIAWVALIYFFVGFTLWEFDAGKWGGIDRSMVVMIGGLIGLIVAWAAAFISTSETTPKK